MQHQLKPETYKEVREILKGTRSAFWWVFFFSFFINFLLLIYPIYMLQVYQRVITSYSLATLGYLTLMALVGLAIFAFLAYLRSRILFNIAHWVDHHISNLVFDLTPDSMLEGNSYPNQVMQDIGQVRQMIIGPNLVVLFDTPWSIIFFLVIFLMHSWFGYSAIGLSIVLMALAILNERATKQNIKNSVDKSRDSSLLFNAILRNIDTLQSMGLSSPLKKLWMTGNLGAANDALASAATSATYLSLIKFFRLGGQITILALGAYLVIENEVTAGVMIASSIIIARALAPVEQVVGAWQQLVSFQSAAKRLMQFTSQPSSRRNGTDLLEIHGEVRVENLFYVHPGNKRFTLQNINFKVDPGTLVAIIGPSAAGKTTLGRLLMGILKPNQGIVRIDGTDAYNHDRTHLGKSLGFLPQDIELFPGTIGENIARMEQNNQKDVITAAQLAGAHSMVLRLPNGYDTAITAQGKGLSLGQMQRIALARALYQEPKVIVLDEPNSNLDREGEIGLFSALTQLKEKHCTTFIISHRMDILRLVDKVLMLANGELVMFADRDAALAKLTQESSKPPK